MLVALDLQREARGGERGAQRLQSIVAGVRPVQREDLVAPGLDPVQDREALEPRRRAFCSGRRRELPLGGTQRGAARPDEVTYSMGANSSLGYR